MNCTVDYEAGNTVASPFAASGGGPAASADESGAGSSFSPVPTLAGVESGLPKATSPFVAGGKIFQYKHFKRRVGGTFTRRW